MKKSYKEFFLGLKEPNFLAMKLLYSLFQRFEKDGVSCRIVDNLKEFSKYDIRLIKSDESFCYVDWYDNYDRIDLAINTSGTEEVTCHEFGHVLLELFARGELPSKFFSVNRKCKNRILNQKNFISNLLKEYVEYTYDKLIEDVDDVVAFYDRHPELKDKYFEQFPDSDEEEMTEQLLESHYALVSAFDNNIDNYNKVSNIIDAIFCGDNPFFLEYGNDSIECVLSMHSGDYFTEGFYGKYVTGFEEQFAEYVALRTYPDKFGEAIGVLRGILGDDWFTMMDKFYDEVTGRIGNKGKVYQHK